MDNSVDSLSVSDLDLTCENCWDNVYLLSYQEVSDSNLGFTEDNSRVRKATPYAEIKGCCVIDYRFANQSRLDDSCYWLRSPTSSIKTNYVGCSGNIGVTQTHDFQNGILPAITIKV